MGLTLAGQMDVDHAYLQNPRGSGCGTAWRRMLLPQPKHLMEEVWKFVDFP